MFLLQYMFLPTLEPSEFFGFECYRHIKSDYSHSIFLNADQKLHKSVTKNISEILGLTGQYKCKQ